MELLALAENKSELVFAQVLSRSSCRQTPVSLFLTTNRITPPHTHQWVFAQGSGNGVHCALGGAWAIRFTVESSDVAQLLEELERYGERGFRDRVLTSLFDDSTTQLVCSMRVPAGGFTNAAQLRAWISEESVFCDTIVRAYGRIKQ